MYTKIDKKEHYLECFFKRFGYVFFLILSDFLSCCLDTYQKKRIITLYFFDLGRQIDVKNDRNETEPNNH